MLIYRFLSYCHPFLPILELSHTGGDHLAEIRDMGAYLFTTVLAIAAGHISHQHRIQGLVMPALDPEPSLKIRRLAYGHFASSMFRRHQSLRDLQATLLLAGWGLHPGSEGPEAWMTTGHCGRLALRLGLHNLGKVVRPTTVLSAVETNKLISQWRTWLCWYW